MKRINLSYLKSSQFISDTIIGMSDGLTVPFALAAGLSGSVANTMLVVIAGFAELAAGCISMGLGGYLSAKSEREYYYSKRDDEMDDVVTDPEKERRDVIAELKGFGLSDETACQAVKELSQSKENWVNFQMDNINNLVKPQDGQAVRSALTIGLAYVCGGIIPLFPYIIFTSSLIALVASVVVTLTALAVFGYLKGKATGVSTWKSVRQTVTVGALASIVAFLIARLIA